MKADHCLQASIVTTEEADVTFSLLLLVTASFGDNFLVDAFAAGLATGVAFFTLGFDTAADTGGGTSFFAAEAIVRPPPLVPVDRVDRAIVWKVVKPVDSLNVTTTGTMYLPNRFIYRLLSAPLRS
jgi:hypothetical protein